MKPATRFLTVVALFALVFTMGAVVSSTLTYTQIENILATDPRPTSIMFNGSNGATVGQSNLYYSPSGVMLSDPGNASGGSYVLTGSTGTAVAGSPVSVHGSYSALPFCLGLSHVTLTGKNVAGTAIGGPWVCLRDVQ